MWEDGDPNLAVRKGLLNLTSNTMHKDSGAMSQAVPTNNNCSCPAHPPLGPPSPAP